MQYRIMLFGCLTLVLFAAGCADLLSRAVGGPESPRPKEYQVQSSETLVTKNLPIVVGAQTNKQDNIKALGEKALEAIENARTPEQVEGITDVFAKGSKAIVAADGTAEITGKMLGATTKNLLQLPLGEYLAYTAGQTIVASRNQELAMEGIKVGWQWTSDKIAGAAGGGAGLLAILTAGGYFLKRATVRRKFLVADGRAINKFKKEEPAAAKKLTHYLAEEQAGVPGDAFKEHGITQV